MTITVRHLLLYKDFSHSKTLATTNSSLAPNDLQRRLSFLREINSLLTKSSKKKDHLLPTIILQLCPLRFPQNIETFQPPTTGLDVSIQPFVK